MAVKQINDVTYKNVLSKNIIEVQLLGRGGILADTPVASLISKSIPYGLKDKGCVSIRDVSFIYGVYAGKYNGPHQEIEIIDIDNDYGLVGAYEKEKIIDIFKKITELRAPSMVTNLENISLRQDVSQEEVDKIMSLLKNTRIHPNQNDAHTIIATSYAKKLLSGGYMHEFFGLTKSQILDIRKLYLNCKADQYFFIPIKLIPFMSQVQPIYSRHANGLFISKAKGTVYRIEPQYYKNKEDYRGYNKKLNIAIKDFVSKIGLTDPTLIPITVTCPQAIVEDRNCMFWTQFIFVEISRNLYRLKDPNLIIQEISSKTATELKTMIYNFKKDLFTKWFPEHEKKFNVRIPIIDDNKELFLKQIDDDYQNDLAKPINVGGKTKRRRHVKTRKIKRRLH